MIVEPSSPQISTGPSGPASRPTAEEDLRAAAVALEAQFLSEMLKHAGLGETRDAFSGGAGETQFASLLREEQARALAEQGGIGLAQSLYEALVQRAEISEAARG